MKVMWGVRDHSGEKNGMPFHTSMRPSRPPCHPSISLSAALGNTRYRPALRITRYPSRHATSGRPAANEVRMVTSSPASAQYRQTIAA